MTQTQHPIKLLTFEEFLAYDDRTDTRYELTEYWIVEPELKQITVCKWVEGQYEDAVFKGTATIASDVVPHWKLIVEQVFAVANQ